MPDILLIIATICLMILTLALITLAVFVFKILSDVRDVLKIIKHESQFVAADIHELRQKIKARAGTATKVAGLLTASGMGRTLLLWAGKQGIKKLTGRR